MQVEKESALKDISPKITTENYRHVEALQVLTKVILTTQGMSNLVVTVSLKHEICVFVPFLIEAEIKFSHRDACFSE